MSSCLTSIGKLILPLREYRIFMAGMQSSGKTSILYLLRLGEMIETRPTIGYNIETVDYGINKKLILMDYGGERQVRVLYRSFAFARPSAMIFVIDASNISDNETIEDTRKYLKEIIEYNDYDNVDVPVLVYVNKEDLLLNGVNLEEIERIFQLNQLFTDNDSNKENNPNNKNKNNNDNNYHYFRGRPWKIQPCSAVKNSGINEGLDWLMQHMYPIKDSY